MADFKRSKLLTHNDLELDCLIISRKPLIAGGEEVLCYAQSRLVKGFIDDDDSLIAELEILIEDMFSPSLDNELSNYGISGDFGF